MFDLDMIKTEVSELQQDSKKNYDKLLNIYLRLYIEYLHFQKTDEDL